MRVTSPAQRHTDPHVVTRSRLTRLEVHRHHSRPLRLLPLSRASRLPTSRGKPMVVRVAERAARSGAAEVLIATDHEGIAEAVRRHGYEAVMTRGAPRFRHRPHRRGRREAPLPGRAHRRQRAGRRAADRAGPDPAGRGRSRPPPRRGDGHGLPPDRERARARQPERGQGRARPRRLRALLQPRRRSPGRATRSRAASRACRRGCRPTATSASTPTARRSCARSRASKPAAIERFEALEQLRALAHGYRIHCAVTRARPAPRRGHAGRPQAYTARAGGNK